MQSLIETSQLVAHPLAKFYLVTFHHSLSQWIIEMNSILEGRAGRVYYSIQQSQQNSNGERIYDVGKLVSCNLPNYFFGLL